MSEETLTQSPPPETAANAERFFRPWYDVESDAGAHTLSVAMPGVSKSGVSVSLEDDLLTVTGHRENPVPETWVPLACEMGHRDYRLALRLNVEIDEGHISAQVEDGMLVLTLPVKEPAKPRQIAIT